MTQLIVVAGTNHRRIALSLLRALLEMGAHVVVITAKTPADIISLHLKEPDQIVWLVSPETIQRRKYAQIRKYIQSRGLHALPIIVEPVNDVPFTRGAITMSSESKSTARQILSFTDVITSRPVSRRRLPLILEGTTLCLIFLVMSSLIFGIAAKPDEMQILPTLAALEVLTPSSAEASDESLVPNIAANTDVFIITREPLARIETESTLDIISATTDDLVSTEAGTATTSAFVEETKEVLPIPEGIVVSAFGVSVTRGDAPLTVELINESSGNITSYAWDFQTDGIIDSQDFEPPPVTFGIPGVYTISLRVENENGTSVLSQSIVEVYQSATADNEAVSSGRTFANFVSSPNSGKFPLQVQFINRSEGNDLTYEWDFNGDGSIDFVGDSPPSYEYKQPGNYTVRLVVTSRDGARDTATGTVSVYSNEPSASLEMVYDEDSQANFDVSPTSGQLPLRVAITNLSVGENNSYQWDFGDDGLVDSSSFQPPEQRYVDEGIYPIVLTVFGFDRFGVPKVTTARLEVSVTSRSTSTLTPSATEIPLVSNNLVADFAASHSQGVAPLSVNFYNFSFGATTYEWDFDGDGAPDSTEFEPTHTFIEAGEYHVMFKALQGDNRAQTSLMIIVEGDATLTEATEISTLVPTTESTSSSTPLPSATFTPTSDSIVVISTTSLTQAATNTDSPMLASTPTSSPSPTIIVSFTSVPTNTAIPVTTSTATYTATATSTLTPTYTDIPTLTATFTPTPTPTFSATPTATSTPTHTITSSPTSST